MIISKEKRLIEMLEGLAPKEVPSWYGSHFYTKGNRLWFQYNSIANIFWIYHLPMLDTFRVEYRMDEEEAKQFLLQSFEKLFMVEGAAIYSWSVGMKEAVEFILIHLGRFAEYTEENLTRMSE